MTAIAARTHRRAGTVHAMATFVLVHGAMHGGWCWRDVRQPLRASGHTVFTPTLTGQGDRRHLLTREVGVSTHVDDLTSLLWYEDLRDVHLVLHSYAGVLAGPVAEAARERLASMTYLAAFLTRSGECLLDVEPSETAVRYRSLAADAGDGWRLPASTAFLAQWGVTDALAPFVGARLTDFPLKCTTDAVTYDTTAWDALRKVYVRHTDPPLSSLDQSHQRAVDGGFELHELACGHDVMLADPEGTVAVLERIASA
jgi:pimeloyl-ACP methyl ester carboxylesterase